MTEWILKNIKRQCQLDNVNVTFGVPFKMLLPLNNHILSAGRNSLLFARTDKVLKISIPISRILSWKSKIRSSRPEMFL